MNKALSIENKGQTAKSRYEVILDWFQVTIFPKNDYKEGQNLVYSNFVSRDKIIPILFKELFGIKSNLLFKELTGFNGYNIRYSYKNINIMIHSEREDMGVNILMKGIGCRDFEELGIGWNNLFERIGTYDDVNFNRIDIAIDSFNSILIDLERIKRYIQQGLCSSKFKKSLTLQENLLKDGSIQSNTIQFGSKASDIEITFYDKFLERTNAGYIIDNNITSWIRLEIRFRHERAKTIFGLIKNLDDYSTYIKSILYNYIDFKDPKSKDSNIARRSTVSWWLEFLDTNDKLCISSRSSERTITKIYNWLLSSTSRSQFMVYLSELPNLKLDILSIDLLYKFLKQGFTVLKDKDLYIINDYRRSVGLIPLTREELSDYVSDLKVSYIKSNINT